MNVIVYVEGASDKKAMEVLLDNLIEEKREQGIAIHFVEAPPGDKKQVMLSKIPIKAANILLNNPDAIVIAMPDLYPKNKCFKHETVAEMSAGIKGNFTEALRAKGQRGREYLYLDRFKVFCFKHDLEALILASLDALRRYLNDIQISEDWIVPVEDQDHDNPPKRIVEALFRQHDRKYHDVLDAPSILRLSSARDIANKCPQCFGPFLDFLENLSRSF